MYVHKMPNPEALEETLSLSFYCDLLPSYQSYLLSTPSLSLPTI